ncbi:MAG: DUF4167 domain-containing protein [Maritimibacter sp.]
MRSSKSRSRGKSNNRNRTPSNNLNRVFDSSGPEGRVRGTPQQIIDKYGQLARDAFLANDRVAGENFQQHAEHYVRILAEAQRDIEAKRQQNDQQQRERQERDQQRREEKQKQRDERPAAAQTDAPAAGEGDQPDLIDPQPSADTGLVETPEMKPKKPRARRPRKKPEAEQTADVASTTPVEKPDGDSPKAAE